MRRKLKSSSRSLLPSSTLLGPKNHIEDLRTPRLVLLWHLQTGPKKMSTSGHIRTKSEAGGLLPKKMMIWKRKITWKWNPRKKRERWKNVYFWRILYRMHRMYVRCPTSLSLLVDPNHSGPLLAQGPLTSNSYIPMPTALTNLGESLSPLTREFYALKIPGGSNGSEIECKDTNHGHYSPEGGIHHWAHRPLKHHQLRKLSADLKGGPILRRL